MKPSPSTPLRRLPAQAWPATSYIAEELEARGVKLQSLLEVINMPRDRWDALQRGEMGLLLKESQAIAGALGLSMEFVANLNQNYMAWKRGQK
jgi:plasmid maintenance system antidote protein VapI